VNWAPDGDNEENFEGAETVPFQQVIYDVDDTEDNEDSDASDDGTDVSDEEEVGERWERVCWLRESNLTLKEESHQIIFIP
jgi:hypothetical protein